MCLAYGGLLDDLRAAGAEYAGFCILDMEGRPSTASLPMYRMPLEGCTATDVCAETRTVLREAYPEDDIRIRDLPCGKAVVRIGDEPLPIPPHLSPNGTSIEGLRGLIQVFVPSPGGTEVVVLELGTPAMEDWDFYSELFAEIVQTLNWTVEEELLFLTQPSDAASSADDNTATITQELHSCSSDVLDALGLHSQVDPDNRLSNIVCPNCSATGHHSPCALVHEWLINTANAEKSATAISLCGSTLRDRGWLETDGGTVWGPSFTAVHTTGYRLDIASSPSGRRLLVKVLTPCWRTEGEVPGPIRHTYRPDN